MDNPLNPPKTDMHPVIQQGLSYWERLRGDRATPMRSDFDPIDIPRLLHYAVFLEVIDGGYDFSYRVVGDHVRTYSLGNHTGQLLSSLPHVEADVALVTSLRKAVATGMPVREPTDYVGPKEDIVKVDEIILPFADGTGAVSHLLILVVMESTLPMPPLSGIEPKG